MKSRTSAAARPYWVWRVLVCFDYPVFAVLEDIQAFGGELLGCGYYFDGRGGEDGGADGFLLLYVVGGIDDSIDFQKFEIGHFGKDRDPELVAEGVRMRIRHHCDFPSLRIKNDVTFQFADVEPADRTQTGKVVQGFAFFWAAGALQDLPADGGGEGEVFGVLGNAEEAGLDEHGVLVSVWVFPDEIDLEAAGGSFATGS